MVFSDPSGNVKVRQLAQGLVIFTFGTAVIVSSPGQGPAALVGIPVGALALGEGLVLIIDSFQDDGGVTKASTQRSFDLSFLNIMSSAQASENFTPASENSSDKDFNFSACKGN